MVAYHYWKCYHSESSAFQTASLYSIEVDYYHFGTCEISDGSYFCGDHSCSTYKHVGEKDVVENLEFSPTMKLYAADKDCTPATDWMSGHVSGAECQARCLEEGYEYAIVADGNCKCAIASECTDITDADGWKIYKKAAPTPGYGRNAQPQGDGFVNRMDNTVGEYEKLDGYWLSETDISNKDVQYWLANTMMSSYKEKGATYVTPWHLHRNIVADGADSCKKACDRDATCRAYQESRWATLSYVIPSCFLFHMPDFVGSYSQVPLTTTADLSAVWWQKASTATDRTRLADFYLKVSNPKTRTWVHVPKVTPMFPHPSGATPQSLLSGTSTSPGRRLEGVY